MNIRERFWDQDAALLAVASAPDGVITAANRAWGTVLGWSPDALVGLHLADLVEVEHPRDTSTMLAAVADTGIAAERLLARTHTTAGLIRRGAMSVHRADGQLLVTLTIDRGDSIGEVRELADRLELAMNCAPIGMAIARLDGPWIAVNPALCDLFGRSPDDLLGGLSFAELTHPDDLAHEAPLLEELLAGARTSYALDKRYRHPDGSDIWTTTVVTLVRDADGTPRHYVAQCLDITERRRVEQQLRDASARLEASDDLRVAFLRATSHELRTPLTAVLGLADTLRRLYPLLPGAQIELLLERLSSNAQHLQALIEDLLDVDRMSVGLLEAAREPVRFDRLVRTALASVELRGRRLVTDLAPLGVEVDAAKVERIVINLVANAVRHTPQDGTVTVRTRHLDGEVELIVEDDGEGIPEELHTAIFDPFVQGPGRANDPQPGTGLGLTLVRDFAALHGGSVQAGSRPGGGTRFTVRLLERCPTTPGA